MSQPIKRLTIEGFKSIRKLEDFELGSLNVLIGANGAGKSNFVSFFRLFKELVNQKLQLAVAKEGGADACLYMGPKVTQMLRAKLYFGANGYEITLVRTADNRLVFAEEATVFQGNYGTIRDTLGSGQLESRLKDLKDQPGKTGQHGVPFYVFESASNWVVYHFHDTSPTAGVRSQGPINDNEFLRPGAENLAAFLYRLRDTNRDYYNKIRDVVRLAAPFFDEFRLRPVPQNPELIQLEWSQKGSDYPFLPSQFSDGTLRFICLATALLQPSPPPTVLFDEPELGMHPYALTLLANLFQQAARQYGSSVVNQAIISTQSAALLNYFAPQDVIVVERANSQSAFRRLESEQFSEWLREYSLGELWQKNVLGGRPRSDVEQSPQIAGGSSDEGRHS